MFTAAFWKAAAERAIKTAGQFGVTALGVTVFTEVGELIPAYQAVGLAGLFGASLSLLTSIASAKVSEQPGPSLTDAEVLPVEGEA